MKNFYAFLLLISFGLLTAQESTPCPDLFEKQQWNLSICLDMRMYAHDKGNHILVTEDSGKVKIIGKYNSQNKDAQSLWQQYFSNPKYPGLMTSYTQKMDGVANNYESYISHKKLVKEKQKTYVKTVTEGIITYKNQYYIITTYDNSSSYSDTSLKFLNRIIQKLKFQGEGQMPVTSIPGTSSISPSTASTSSATTTSTQSSSSKSGNTSAPTLSSGGTNVFVMKLKNAMKSSTQESKVVITESILRANASDEAHMEIDDFKPEMERWKRSVTYSLSQLRKCNSRTIANSSFTKRTSDPYAPIQYVDGEITVNCDGTQKKYLVTCLDVNGTLYLARMYIPRK
ncbi:MAG: hypothetical protein HRT68_03830 [Flavobacteriaceae bacterium]|nr:hypothetical protein [Flavobacteriaceae bacterium]